MNRIAERPVPVWAIHATNLLLLAVLLVVAPMLGGIDAGPVVASSWTWLERLVIAGLGVGLAANALVGWGVGEDRRRRTCLGWAALHLMILVVGLMAHWEWIRFDWLERLMGWAMRGVGMGD